MEAPSADFVVLKNTNGEITLVDLRLVPALTFFGEEVRVHFNGTWMADRADAHPGLVDAWKFARDFAAYVPNN